jgi:hypothetical protein
MAILFLDFEEYCSSGIFHPSIPLGEIIQI